MQLACELKLVCHEIVCDLEVQNELSRRVEHMHNDGRCICEREMDLDGSAVWNGYGVFGVCAADRMYSYPRAQIVFI
jgi:hypothetical protein